MDAEANFQLIRYTLIRLVRARGSNFYVVMHTKFSQCIMLGSGMCKHAETRGSGACSPRKILKFTVSETASGPILTGIL